MSKSLFMVGEIGGNDYLGPWAFNMLTQQQVTAYVPTVVEAIKNATEVMIRSISTYRAGFHGRC